MRWWVIVSSLWLLTVISLCDTQTGAPGQRQPHGGAPDGGKRRRSGQGRSRGDRPKQLRRRLVPGQSIPVNHRGNDGTTLFIESYKNLGEPPSIYNIIPGKQGQCVYQGMKMFDQAVWSPKPCVTCLCAGGQVLCDEVTCPPARCHFPYTAEGECCPVCLEQVPELSDFSGDSSVPSDPNSVPLTPDLRTPPLTPEEIQRIIWMEEEEHQEEEERLKRRDERRRKKKKEEAERKRKLAAEKKRKRGEEEKRRQEEEEDRRRMEEEERRRQEKEEDRRVKEAAERESREKEKKLEEERRRHEEVLKERLRALEELEEEEEEVWLRGDVFAMSTNEPEELDLRPAPIPRPPVEEEEAEEEEESEVEQRNRAGLPPGCDISDVIVTCENAGLTHFPPLSIPQLKSLSLEGNSISSIPEGAFNGIPNLEWINLSKNKLTSAGIASRIFKGLKLNRLYLDNNLLEEIPSGLPSTLQELKINENLISTVDEKVLQDLSSLVILELEGNILSEGNVAPEAFSGLQELSYLRLGRNHFRTIPQGLPDTLLELYLENNLIEEISEGAFNQTTNLNVISLRHNRLDETRIAPLAWINHKRLESIDLSHNQLYLVPSYLPRPLVHLVVVGNQIERIPGFVFAHMDPGLEYLYLSYNKLDVDGIEPESFFGSFHSMVELCLDHNQLVNVPSGINEMTALHFLRLNNNHIRSVPIDSICDPQNEEDSHLVALRLENNYIDTRNISPTAFSCVRSYSSVVYKPQYKCLGCPV